MSSASLSCTYVSLGGKCFLARTDSFVNVNNTLNSNQYGFRTNNIFMSTSHEIIELI